MGCALKIVRYSSMSMGSALLILWYTKFFNGLCAKNSSIFKYVDGLRTVRYFAVQSISMGCVILLIWYTKYLYVLRTIRSLVY